jgi:hypothetical protein
MRNNLSLTQFLLMTVLASSEERSTAAMSLKAVGRALTLTENFVPIPTIRIHLS